MAPFKDLLRLVNGASLIAAEAAKGSRPIAAARTGDIETLISQTLKNALLSATDLAGLTKGRIREVFTPKPKESVVYFSDPPTAESESATSRSDPLEAAVAALEAPAVETEENIVNLVDKEEDNGKEVVKVGNTVNSGEENEKNMRGSGGSCEEKAAEGETSPINAVQ